MNKTFYRICTYLFVFLVPALFIYSFTLSFGTNVIRWDEIEFAVAQDKGNLYLDNFFVVKNYLLNHHNEHLIFIPSIVYWVVGVFSKFNSVVQMLVSNTSLLILFYSISFTFIKYTDLKSNKKWLIVNFILASIILNLSQFDNLLWAFQIGFILTFVFSIFSFIFYALFLDNKKNKHFLFTILFCILSSLSSAQGILSWIVVIFMSLHNVHFFKTNKTKPVVFFACLVITFFVFFVTYKHPEYHPSTLFVFEHPIIFLKHYLITLGAIEGPGSKGFLLGLIFLIISISAIIFFLKNKNNIDSLLYFSIGCIIYGLFSSGLISVGRAGFGIEQGSASRYVTFTMSVLLGEFLFVYHLIKNKKIDNLISEIIRFFIKDEKEIVKYNNRKLFIHKYIVYVIAISLSVALTITNILQLKNIHDYTNSNKKAEFIFKNLEEMPYSIVEKYGIYPSYSKAKEAHDNLLRRKFNVFAKDKMNVNNIPTKTCEGKLLYQINEKSFNLVNDKRSPYLEFNSYLLSNKLNKNSQILILNIDNNFFNTLNNLHYKIKNTIFSNLKNNKLGIWGIVPLDKISKNNDHTLKVIIISPQNRCIIENNFSLKFTINEKTISVTEFHQ